MSSLLVLGTGQSLFPGNAPSGPLPAGADKQSEKTPEMNAQPAGAGPPPVSGVGTGPWTVTQASVLQSVPARARENAQTIAAASMEKMKVQQLLSTLKDVSDIGPARPSEQAAPFVAGSSSGS